MTRVSALDATLSGRTGGIAFALCVVGEGCNETYDGVALPYVMKRDGLTATHIWSNAGESGGTQALRGFEFQAQSLVHYLLQRLIAHRELRMHVERIEDALIEYEGGIHELVQCNKAEDKNSDRVLSGYGDDVVRIGTFGPKDLKKWFAHEWRGVSLDKQLEKDGAFLTALLLSDLSTGIAGFQAPRQGRRAAELWNRPDFEELFPIDWVHKKDPDKSGRPARRKVRLVLMSAWADIGLFSERLLRDRYQVSRPSEALGSLLRLYTECAVANDPEEKIITGAAVSALLDRFRPLGSRWMSARTWLSGAIPPRWVAEPMLEWDDFEADRYFHSPQFDQVLQALERDRFVYVYGQAGSGKSTLARYLAYRFLKDHPDRDGYVLVLDPDFVIGSEKQVVESLVGTPTVFVIEDAHFAPEAAKELARAYHDRSLSGTVASRLIVTSHEMYTRRMLLDPGKQDDPFAYAYHVRFSPLSSDALAAQLNELAVRTRQRLPFPALTIAEIAAGKIGLALLIIRAANDLGAKTVQRLIDDHRLHELFKRWILLKTGINPVMFDEEILPVLNITSFGIALDDDFGPGVQILRDAGFLIDQPRERKARSMESALTYLLNVHNPARVSASIQRLFDRNPRDLPTLARRLVQSKFGKQMLKRLAESRTKQIAEALSDLGDPMSLGDVASVLDAIHRAGRREALDLFRSLGAARDALSVAFVDTFIRVDRLLRPSMISRFFDVLFHVDRHLLRDLGHKLDAESRYGDYLFAALRAHGASLGDVASALAAIARCSRKIALQIFEKLETDHSFAPRLAGAEREPDQAADLLRYCALSYRLMPARVGVILDRRFSEKRLYSFIVGAGDHNAALIVLRKLRRLRPRVVAETLARVWRDNREFLLQRGIQNTFGEYAQLILLVSHLNRRVARAVADATVMSALELVRTARHASEVVPALVTLDRAVGREVANVLATAADREKLLYSLQNETQRFDAIGKNLSALAHIRRDLAQWLATRIEIEEVIKRITTHPLLNLNYILHGMLLSLSPDEDAAQRSALLSSGVVRDLYQKAWRADRALIQATLAVQLLGHASLTEDEILMLTGHSDQADLEAELIKRFTDENSLLHVAGGLCQIADICPEVAGLAAVACVEALPSDTSSGSQPVTSAFRARPRYTRKGLSAYANSLVECGAMLRVTAALNPAAALKLAEKLDIQRMAASVRSEVNLGRLAAFLSGLHDASRDLCRQLVRSTATDEVWEVQTVENDSARNIIHFANVLGRISKSYGVQFVRFAAEHVAEEVRNFIEVESTLPDIVDWIRVLRVSSPDPSQIDALLPALHESIEYDRSALHLLDAANALMECGRRDEALDLAGIAATHRGQLRYLRRVEDFVKVLHRAVALEDALGDTGFAERLMAEISVEDLTRLLSDRPLKVDRDRSLLVAYAIHLLHARGGSGFGRFAPVVRDVRRHLINAVATEGRPLYRGVIAILAEAPVSFVTAVEANHDWPILWERGLFHVIAQMTGYDSNITREPTIALTPTPPRELSAHASNMTFALAARLAFPILPSTDQERLQQEGLLRADDERVSAIQRLLTTLPGTDTDRPATWHIWTVLRETVLRRAYLPWSSVVEAEAFPDELLEKSFDVRVISA